MRFNIGTMIYGRCQNIDFIGTIAAAPLPDGRIRLENVAMKMDKWVSIEGPTYEREPSFISEIDVDMFDLLHDLKKQPGITFEEYLQRIRVGDR